MTDIRQSRFQQLLRRVMAITDRFAPALIEDIMPVYPVEDPSDPHLQFDKDVRIVALSTAITSAVADFPVVDLGPTVLNSDSILDVLFFYLSAGGTAMACTVEHNPNLAAVVPGAILSPTDGRVLKTTDSTTPGRSNFTWSGQIAGISAIPNNAIWAGFLPVNQVLIVPWKGTLYRSNYRFKFALVNTTIRVGILALDRTVEPTEVRPAPGGAGP